MQAVCSSEAGQLLDLDSVRGLFSPFDSEVGVNLDGGSFTITFSSLSAASCYAASEIHDHLIWREPSVLEGFEIFLIESLVHISGKP